MNEMAAPRPHCWLLNAALYYRYAGVRVVLAGPPCVPV